MVVYSNKIFSNPEFFILMGFEYDVFVCTYHVETIVMLMKK